MGGLVAGGRFDGLAAGIRGGRKRVRRDPEASAAHRHDREQGAHRPAVGAARRPARRRRVPRGPPPALRRPGPGAVLVAVRGLPTDRAGRAPRLQLDVGALPPDVAPRQRGRGASGAARRRGGAGGARARVPRGRPQSRPALGGRDGCGADDAPRGRDPVPVAALRGAQAGRCHHHRGDARGGRRCRRGRRLDRARDAADAVGGDDPGRGLRRRPAQAGSRAARSAGRGRDRRPRRPVPAARRPPGPPRDPLGRQRPRAPGRRGRRRPPTCPCRSCRR